MKATRDWDARTYSRVGTPMARWGERLIDRLELRGDETVLDAGCGSGGVTAKLLDRLPSGRVIAVDGSPSMVAAAREALPADRVQTQVCDLTELELDEPVDQALAPLRHRCAHAAVGPRVPVPRRLHSAVVTGPDRSRSRS